MPPTYTGFHQYIKRVHLKSLIFSEADSYIIEMENAVEFGWKCNGTQYISIVTGNPIAPGTVTNFALCNCKGKFFSLFFFVERLFYYIIIIFFDYFRVSVALIFQLLRAWSTLFGRGVLL